MREFDVQFTHMHAPKYITMSTQHLQYSVMIEYTDLMQCLEILRTLVKKDARLLKLWRVLEGIVFVLSLREEDLAFMVLSLPTLHIIKDEPVT